LERKVDFLIDADDDIRNLLDDVACDCLLVDEVQFLQPHHIDELWELAVLHNIPVICYGLRADFQMQ
jgi:thymidine kinase